LGPSRSERGMEILRADVARIGQEVEMEQAEESIDGSSQI